MNQKHTYSTDALFKGLRGLLNSLPTEDEKSELLRNLREAQNFLDEMHFLVEAIPTMESSRELSEGLSRLDILTDRAYRDPSLRKLLGLRGSYPGRRQKAPQSKENQKYLDDLESEIAQAKTSEITDLLSRESVSSLKQLASHFGVRTLSKERKSDIVGRIATHIENQRGYSMLRGGDS